MDNTRLTIACEENREGGYEIDVTFERDSRTQFREAFISLDRPMPPYLIEESDINGVGAVKNQQRQAFYLILRMSSVKV